MGQTETIGADLDERLGQCARSVEEAIEGYLAHDPGVPETLRKAMFYSLRAGGKRLRPAMILLACRACGGEVIRALPAAAAMEMVHTYSLIHDDLPAMDDDDLRRGQPTNHKVFGDGVAILAGDALLTYAFQVLAQHVEKDSLARRLVLELAAAAGAAGMIGGQVADLETQHGCGALETVQYIHTHKTALMFRAAARMGALCADANPRRLDQLGDYGLKVGLAFQIIDDLLDIAGTPAEMGKRTQKDAAAGKLTYPAVVGLDQSRHEAAQLVEQAVVALDELGPPAEPLRTLARRIVSRRS